MPKDERTTIVELQEAVRTFCEERDWDQFHGPKELAIGAATEAAELLAEFRFLSDAEALERVADGCARLAIEGELADVLFFLLRFADRYDIDLADALERKLVENADRYPVGAARGSNKKYTEL